MESKAPNPTRRDGTWWEQQKIWLGRVELRGIDKKIQLKGVKKLGGSDRKSTLTNICKRGNGFGEHDITWPLLSI